MKILLYSDLHAANIYSFNVKLSKYNISEYSRIDELYSTLAWISNVVKNNDIMIPINLGDTFHQALRFYVERLNTVNKAINSINQSSLTKSGIVIEGNHDRTDEISAVDIFENVSGTMLVNSTVKIKFISEINSYFIFIPYIRDQERVRNLFDKLYEKFRKVPANKYVFCHLDIREIYEGFTSSTYQINVMNRYDDLNLNIYKAVFSGHIHFKRQIKDNFFYIGTTLNHNFSDSFDRKGVAIVDFSADNYKISYLENPFCPLFCKINVEKENDADKKIEKIREELRKFPLTNVYVRIYSYNNENSRNKALVFIEKFKEFFTAYETKAIDSDEDIDALIAHSTSIDSVNVIDLIIDKAKKILEFHGKTSEIDEYINRLKKICLIN